MIYICSDIHAEYDLFIKLMKAINFSDHDIMYIGGDIIDKGNDSIRLMQFIMNSPNIHTIIGNHEYEFLKFYWALMKETSEDFDDVLKKLQKLFPYDGHLLDWATVDYIESLPYFINTEEFILVHSGLPIDTNNQIVFPKKLKPEYLLYDRQFKEPKILPKTDKCVFFGHTPTNYICNTSKILKYKKQGFVGNNIKDYCKIHLDVGTWITGTMACICINTLEEFYISK